MTKANNTTTERHTCTNCQTRGTDEPAGICFICEASQIFLQKARAKWGTRFDYSKEINRPRFFDLYLKCNDCGAEFKTNPTRHMAHAFGGCNECDRLQRQAGFIAKAVAKHGNRYNYDPNTLNYQSLEKPIFYQCPQHGAVSQQKAKNHLEGTGCQQCGQEIGGGWSRSDFVNRCKITNNGKAIFYVIRCRARGEIFYKCGITSNNVAKRFGNADAMPYDYQTILQTEGEAGAIYDLEKHIIRTNKKHRYTPKKQFAGHSECFEQLAPSTQRALNIKLD